MINRTLRYDSSSENKTFALPNMRQLAKSNLVVLCRKLFLRYCRVSAILGSFCAFVRVFLWFMCVNMCCYLMCHEYSVKLCFIYIVFFWSKIKINIWRLTLPKVSKYLVFIGLISICPTYCVHNKYCNRALQVN